MPRCPCGGRSPWCARCSAPSWEGTAGAGLRSMSVQRTPLLAEVDGENEPDGTCADDEDFRIDRLIIILRVRGIVALATALVFGLAGAQDFPARPVHLIVPYTPGTGADILARLLGARLAERWKVGVVTENKPGRDRQHRRRVRGEERARRLYAALRRDVVRHHAGARQSAVRPGEGLRAGRARGDERPRPGGEPAASPRSMRELIELAKREPGKLHYSSPGNGGPQHLAMELLKLELGMDIVHVPYKTAAERWAMSLAGMCRRRSPRCRPRSRRSRPGSCARSRC